MVTTKKDRKQVGGLESRPAITVDVEEFEHFLEESNMTDDEKAALLQTYWNLFVEITSIGWGVHPVQQALEAKKACGKRADPPIETGAVTDNAVYCLDKTFIKEFDAVARLETERNGKGVGP